jgi:hypothetical protein
MYKEFQRMNFNFKYPLVSNHLLFFSFAHRCDWGEMDIMIYYLNTIGIKKSSF